MSYYSMELTEHENDKIKLKVFWAGQMFYEKEYDSIWIAGNVGTDKIMKHRKKRLRDGD